MKKSVLQNEEYLKSIQERGELALPSKNEKGVNVFSGSDDTNGLVSGRLYTPKYNLDELLKSVDVEIDELLPQTPPEVGSFVTRSLYEEQIQINEERLDEIERLTTDVRNLSSEVQTLNLVTESLNREIDGLKLVGTATDNQLQNIQEDFSNQTSDLQNAIQNSVKESIERVSLQSRNDALKQELDLLREQLFGKQSQIEAGAQSSGTLFTVNTSPIADKDQPAIRGSKKLTDARLEKNRKILNTKWVNGEKLTLLNTSETDITLSFKTLGTKGVWIKTPPSFLLAPNEKRTINLQINQQEYTSKDKQSANKNYDDILQVIGKDVNGNEETIEIETRLRKWIGE